MIKNTATTYGSVAKFFHWLLFILIAVMLVVGFFMGDLPKSIAPTVYDIHKLVGMTVLILMLLRLLWALNNVKPLLPAGTPAWQHFAERGGHFLLYLSVILMPIFGYVGSLAAGRPPHIGDFMLNFLPIPQDKALSKMAFDMHALLALILIGLVTIHVAAALYHHFIKKDDILRRMLPAHRR